MKRSGLGLGLVLVVGMVGTTFVQHAAAATSVQCGQRITQSIRLTADVGPCPGDGLVVNRASGITVDLGGHTVSGNRARGNDSVGIRLIRSTGVTVRNGAVTGFDAGVDILRGSANTIDTLNVHDNIGTLDNPFGIQFGDGILVDGSSGNRLVHNRIVHNGPLDGIAVIEVGADDNTIEGNLIKNNNLVQVLHAPDGGGDYPLATDRGVFVSSFSSPVGRAIRGTTIVGNTVRGNGANGIETFVVTQDTTIVHNVVEGNGFGNAVVNGGSAGLEIGDAGIVKGDGSGRATIVTNQVHGNAGGGIMLIGCCGSPYTYLDGQNTVLFNDAADNVASPANDVAAADLWDTAYGPDCESDTWFGNTWGSGGFEPPCTTVGGSGPPNPSPLAAASASASPNQPSPVVAPRSRSPRSA